MLEHQKTCEAVRGGGTQTRGLTNRLLAWRSEGFLVGNSNVVDDFFKKTSGKRKLGNTL